MICSLEIFFLKSFFHQVENKRDNKQLTKLEEEKEKDKKNHKIGIVRNVPFYIKYEK